MLLLWYNQLILSKITSSLTSHSFCHPTPLPITSPPPHPHPSVCLSVCLSHICWLAPFLYSLCHVGNSVKCVFIVAFTFLFFFSVLQQVQNINSQILWLVWAFGCTVLVSTVSHCTKSTYHNSFHLSHRYSHLIHHTPCSETHTACCCRWTLTPGMPDMLTAHGHRNIPLVSDGLLPLRHFRYSKSALTTLFSVVNPQQTNKEILEKL